MTELKFEPSMSKLFSVLRLTYESAQLVRKS